LSGGAGSNTHAAPKTTEWKSAPSTERTSAAGATAHLPSRTLRGDRTDDGGDAVVGAGNARVTLHMERDGNEPFDVCVITSGPDAHTRAYTHTVETVVFGTFADRCGLLVGDTILAIGGRLASTLDGHAIWDALDALGARFDLVVSRKAADK
jgi:hypothetical protein